MLVRWAEKSGFVTRRSQGGTSHIVCQHKQYPDIVFKIIADSDKCWSQYDFGKALKKIHARESGAAFEFSEKSRNDVALAYKNLPPYLTADHDFENGQTVLRDKQLPQLGITIPFEDSRMAENKVRYLEAIKREAFILLNRAKMEYDIDFKNNDGKFGGTLSHAMYDIEPKIIPPYQAGGDPHGIMCEINDFILKVMEKDDAHDKKLDTLLAHDFVGAAKIAFHARRGERSNAVRLERPDGGAFTLIFETASNRRADAGDIHRGRISEQELSRVEKTIQSIAKAHGRADKAELHAA